MKKKTSAFLALLLSVSTLSGCSFFNNIMDKIKGKTADDDQTVAEPLYKGMGIKDKEAKSLKRAETQPTYVLRKNEDFLFEINFENPANFEIQSFTINDTKYANYMFEKGSTLEKILIKSKAPGEHGEYTYTIDAIKYIDGESIKDVKIGGNKTVKGSVQPYVIQLDANGGTVSQTEIKLDSGDELVLPTPTKDGDEFLGWFDEGGNEVKNHTFDENSDLKLIARYLSNLPSGTCYKLNDSEKTAIQQVLAGNLCGYMTGEVGTQTAVFDAFFHENTQNLVLKKTTTVLLEQYDVTIEWNIDTTSLAFNRFINETTESKDVELNFPTEVGDEYVLNLSINRVFCGDGFYYKPGINFQLKTKKSDAVLPYYSIAEVYSITNAEKTVNAGGQSVTYPSTYDLIDYEYHNGTSYKPYFIPNNQDIEGFADYLYCEVPGKVIYAAPDGNFLLLADGKNVIEVYGGLLHLDAENFPALTNDYVKISGNLSEYNANIQLGFVFNISPLSSEEIAEIEDPEPLEYFTLTEEFLNSLHVDGNACDKQAVILSNGGCLANCLASVTGTLVPDSISNISSLDVSKRFSFKLQVGEEQITIAYDYHVDHEVGTALKNALLSNGAMTIKGTMRYSGHDFTTLQPGSWTMVPFLTSHVNY